MTVVVKYVVVRNGKEVMTFATKKEADAHDKQLDIAERLQTFLATAELEIGDEQLDELSFFMAKHRDAMIGLLRGGKTAPAASKQTSPDPDNTAATTVKTKSSSPPAEPSRKTKTRTTRGRKTAV